jgi:serine phosphatase RsbU (regulator of sigma subunit)
MTTLSDTRAQIPDDDAEHARQHSLDQLALVDTKGEERFDQITRLARRVFRVPISTVSLLDNDRLWFKAVNGFDVREMPRVDTFCHRAVEEVKGGRDDLLVVSENTTTDPIFASLPLAQDGSIRFYAGYPLFGPGGYAVGIFCIYDSVPRTFDAEQRAALIEMAQWAQRELTSGDDLQRAAQVQRQLLPETAPVVDGYEVDGVCSPAFQVGGDFYDLYPVPGGMMLTVADVMGKGTAAAIITASVRAVLRGISRTVASTGVGDLDLGRSMVLASTLLHDDLEQTSSFVTAFHARLEASTGVLDYADAGHGLTAILRSDSTVEWLPSDDLPIGVLAASKWKPRSAVLAEGETVLSFSDGLLEVFGPSEQDAIRQIEVLLRTHPRTADLIDTIHHLARSTEALDDVTAVALRRLGSADR